MFYIIYKITNKLDNKYYIGMHKTKNIEDGYMGSGKYLKLAIIKHGLENFTKEILFVFDNEQEMLDKEKELVVVCEHSYNLCEGGKGGFGYINQNNISKFNGKKHTPETIEKLKSIAKNRKHKPFENHIPWNKGKKDIHSKERMEQLKKPRSEETKKKISETIKNKKNAVLV